MGATEEEENSLRRKRISLDSSVVSLPDSAICANDSRPSHVQEQVWMVQWYNISELNFRLIIIITMHIGGIHSIENIRHGMVMGLSL